MSTWLWEAGTYRGITDDVTHAKAAAAACLTGAAIARVEMAYLVLGADLANAYERAGVGWTGQTTAGWVAWSLIEDSPL